MGRLLGSSFFIINQKEAIPMVKNKQCLTCRKHFSYCPDCSRVDKLKPAWASQFCSEPCATLWITLTKFGMSMIDKTEAKSIISELDLKPIESYVQCVQRDYANVMAEEKKPKRGKRAEMQIIIDEVVDIPKEVVELVVEDSTVHEVVNQENE